MKKSVKILIIVLILIIVGLATFIVVDKVINKENNETLRNETNLVNETNNAEKETTLKNNLEENDTNETQNEAELLSESEALDIGKQKFEKACSYAWDAKFDENKKITTENGEAYEIINVKEMKEFFTDEGFKILCEQYAHGIAEINGNYYTYNGGIGGNPEFLSQELSVESISENKIIFTSNAKYYNNPNDYDKDESLITDYRIETSKFILIKENGKWLVDDFTDPR